MNRVLKPIPKLTVLAIVAGLSLAACGGSDSTSEPAKPVALTGVFLDGAVEGLDYVAGSAAKASTNAKGEFTCMPGDTVTFSVGGLALARRSAAS
jgi:ABC-type glycerol-3-phosphate transport system substrate-binding protein